MQGLVAAACPPSPSSLLANAVKPLRVRNSDVHSHSAFSNLSPCASPARDSSPEPDEPPAAQPAQQQQQLTAAHYAAPQPGFCGAAGAASQLQLLFGGASCPAAMRSRSSFASGLTASTMVPTPHGAPRADPAAAAAAAAAAPVGVKSEAIELIDDESDGAEDGQAAAAAAAAAVAHAAVEAAAAAEAAALAEAAEAAAVAQAAAAKTAAAAAAQAAAAAGGAADSYDEAALPGDGPGAINLTSKSRPTYSNSSNQQDTRVMLVRRLRAMLAAAGAARGGVTLGDVYDYINTNGGLSTRGLKWLKPHLDDFYTTGLGVKGAAGSAPWPTAQELKPYMELRYLARLLSWVTGRLVTVPEVNALFVDGTAEWTVHEALVVELLGVPVSELQLPLQQPQQQMPPPPPPQQPPPPPPPAVPQPPAPQPPQQQQLAALPPSQQQQQQQQQQHSSHMSGGTGFAPVHGSAGAAAAALAGAKAGSKLSNKRSNPAAASGGAQQQKKKAKLDPAAAAAAAAALGSRVKSEKR